MHHHQIPDSRKVPLERIHLFLGSGRESPAITFDNDAPADEIGVRDDGGGTLPDAGAFGAQEGGAEVITYIRSVGRSKKNRKR